MTHFLADFLAQRRPAVRTCCEHPPFALRFEVATPAGPQAFTVAFHDGSAALDDGTAPDHVVHCDEAELRAVAENRRELLGPFWQRHVAGRFSWAASLYAFFFPGHPYAELSPVLGPLYRTARFYPATTPFTQGYRLYQLARRHGLERTLEIGLAFGGSALFLAQAHRSRNAGHHVAVDPFERSEYGDQALEFIHDAGCGAFFTHLPLTGREAFAQFARERRRFDLVYIDGDHGLGHVLNDFLGAHAVLREGGLLAFDDSHFPSGQRVLGVVRRRFGYTLLDDSTDRFTVLRKERHTRPPLALRAAAALDRAELPMKAVLKALR